MIYADRTGQAPYRYTLRREQRPFGSVTLGPRMSGGVFEVDGTAYEVRAGAVRGAYDLLAADGSVPATAERVHARNWALRTVHGSSAFRRAGFARVESLADAHGREVGRITVSRRGPAVVDLPGLDVPVQAFALTLALMRRRRRRRIATRTAAASTLGR